MQQDASLKEACLSQITCLASGPQTPKSGVEADDTCKVCYDARINSVLIRCGHMAVCMECSHQLEKCPICRTEIVDVIQTYKV